MKTIYLIGREPDCDIFLCSNANEISRHHAQIRIDQQGKFWLLDMSLHGTYVNGMRIPYNQEVMVSRKDEILFAGVERFDWKTIPNKRNNWLWIGISIGTFVLVAIGVILCLVLIPKDDSVENDTVLTEETCTPVKEAVESVSVEKQDADTVVNKVTKVEITIPSEKEHEEPPQKTEKKKSKDVSEKISEEIYNNRRKQKEKKAKKAAQETAEQSSKLSSEEQVSQESEEKEVIDAIF